MINLYLLKLQEQGIVDNLKKKHASYQQCNISKANLSSALDALKKVNEIFPTLKKKENIDFYTNDKNKITQQIKISKENIKKYCK